jgi:hypothetical protein
VFVRRAYANSPATLTWTVSELIFAANSPKAILRPHRIDSLPVIDPLSGGIITPLSANRAVRLTESPAVRAAECFPTKALIAAMSSASAGASETPAPVESDLL